MVRAILEGRKSCTRRLVKPEPQGYFEISEEPLYIYDTDGNQGKITPPYQPGDILYVRETIWQKIGYYLDIDGETKPSWYNEFKYVASDEKPETGWNYSWVKRPSIHMPKEAARIWLKVTDVRVERLQSITEGGAIREGAEGEKCHHTNAGAFGCTDCMNTGWIEPPQFEFMQIWDSTIKKSDLDRYGWDANPWVWVIEFERCEKPEGKNC